MGDFFGDYFGATSSDVPSSDVDVWGTRAGIEQKIGVRNLKEYVFLGDTDDDPQADPEPASIETAITDDLVEAATDMAMAWREFTATALGFSTHLEERWLADTNEYGAAVKAWAGRNVERAQSEEVPQQIATAQREWAERLEKLRTGAVLLDYQDEEDIDEDEGWESQDAPVSVGPTVDPQGRTINDPPPAGYYWDGNAGAYRWGSGGTN